MNKKRIIFWGIITIILIILSISGKLLMNNGYGKNGEVVKKLTPINDTFNNIEEIKTISNAGIYITSKVKSDKLVISYDTDTSSSSYNYKYENDILSLEYKEEDKSSVYIISKYLIEAISVNKGYTYGNVFNKYTIEDFIDSDISNGVSIIKNNDINTIKINLNITPLETSFKSTHKQEINIDEMDKEIVLDDIISYNNPVEFVIQDDSTSYYKHYIYGDCSYEIFKSINTEDNIIKYFNTKYQTTFNSLNEWINLETLDSNITNYIYVKNINNNIIFYKFTTTSHSDTCINYLTTINQTIKSLN